MMIIQRTLYDESSIHNKGRKTNDEGEKEGISLKCWYAHNKRRKVHDPRDQKVVEKHILRVSRVSTA